MWVNHRINILRQYLSFKITDYECRPYESEFLNIIIRYCGTKAKNPTNHGARITSTPELMSDWGAKNLKIRDIEVHNNAPAIHCESTNPAKVHTIKPVYYGFPLLNPLDPGNSRINPRSRFGKYRANYAYRRETRRYIRM